MGIGIGENTSMHQCRNVYFRHLSRLLSANPGNLLTIYPYTLSIHSIRKANWSGGFTFPNIHSICRCRRAHRIHRARCGTTSAEFGAMPAMRKMNSSNRYANECMYIVLVLYICFIPAASSAPEQLLRALISSSVTQAATYTLLHPRILFSTTEKNVLYTFFFNSTCSESPKSQPACV